MCRLASRILRRLPGAGRVLRERDRAWAEVETVAAERNALLARNLWARAAATRALVGAGDGLGWPALLSDIQDEIEAAPDTRAYYREMYRATEVAYWPHLPAWLWADHALHPIRRLLDVGCAYGTLALLVRRGLGAECDLVDFNTTYLSPTIAGRHGLRFVATNVELEPLPWPEVRYDAILFTEVLEHLNFHPVPTLRKLRAALAPRGRLYLTTPDAAEWGRITTHWPSIAAMEPPAAGRPVFDGHVWQYEEAELRQVLAAAGLAIERFALAPGIEARHFNLTATAI